MEIQRTVEYDYDAFISYRHFEKDTKIAQQLQKYLEKHKITEKKGEKNRKRTLRVFRDESELPSSSDLGGDIHRALERSRYLILICSPKYQESRWCMEEVAYFRHLHGNTNKNILTLLIAGEPKEAFPELICREERQVTLEDGSVISVRQEIEPLAADIRADSEKEMLKKLKIEQLRIAAPILGLSFDDLFQRKKQEKRKILAAASGITAMLAMAFGIYSTYMLRQISKKQSEILENESVRLAEASDQAMDSGDNLLAMLLAEKALEFHDAAGYSDGVPSDAQIALQNAVYQEQYERQYYTMGCRCVISTNGPFQVMNTYADGGKMVVSDFSVTRLYDCYTGNLIFEIPGEIVYFNEDASLCVAVRSYDNYASAALEGYRTDDGVKIFEETVFFDTLPASDYAYSIDQCFVIFEEETNDCYLGVRYYADGAENLLICSYTSYGERKEINDVPTGITERMSGNNLFSYWSLTQYDYEYSSREKAFYDAQYQKVVPPEEILSAVQNLQLKNVQVNNITFAEERDWVVFEVTLSDGTHQTRMYSTESSSFFVIANGTYILISGSNLLYKQEEGVIYIMEIHEDNRSRVGSGDYYRYISADGTKALWLEEEFGSGVSTVKIAACDALNDILFEENIPYYLNTYDVIAQITKNMDYIFYADSSDNLYLREIAGACLVQIEPPQGDCTAAALREDTQLAAAAFTNGAASDNGSMVYVYELPSGRCIRSIAVEGTVNYLELLDDRLLVSGGNTALLYDLLEEEDAPTEFALFTAMQKSILPRYLTEDGLLFEVYDTNTLYALGSIFDAETGETVFADSCRAYDYDSSSGYLVYQSMAYNTITGSIHVLKWNGAEGRFEEQYQIKSDHYAMQVPSHDMVLEGNYLLLSGFYTTEVYELITGKCILKVNKPDLALQNGRLYDMEMDGGNYIISFPLEQDLDSLLTAADTYLRSEFGLRRLSQYELEEYFILESALDS